MERFRIIRETIGSDSPMRTLLLDTSTERGVVALADGDQLRWQQSLPAERKHARDLVPAMKSACQSLGWKLRDVGLLVVSAGPGSYTGLRVGIAAVKATAMASKAAIVALDSLEVVAQGTGSGERIVAVADAQQQRIYSAWFRRRNDAFVERVAPTTLQATEDWIASLQPGDVVTGPAVHRWLDRIPASCTILPAEQRLPTAESLLALALRERDAGRFADLYSLEPSYLRPSAAEERSAERRRA